ncbi:MAG: hypothetical protein JW806_08320 [Sedimentisphaerales bacterium]|nr:hypothetical protein [Sedimentisphaerales bacterium]
MKNVFSLLGIVVILFSCVAAAWAIEQRPIGWVTVTDGNLPYTITGGAAGATVTATNETEFKTYAGSTSPYVILVPNMIVMTRGTSSSYTPQTVNVESNKTIIGTSPDAGINGGLSFSGESNVIVRNLTIWYEDGSQGYDNPWTDGISIKDSSHHIWIDHCSLYDSPDGLIDITNQSNYITISWCYFYYLPTSENINHHFTNLVGHSATNYADRGKLKVTFHHNWWGLRCRERMPRVRFGQVHIFNNYYYNEYATCINNNAIRSGIEAQNLVENNYFYYIDEPIEEKYDPTALIEAVGNILDSCCSLDECDDGDDDVFDPPYPYTLDDANDVPTIVTAGVGAGYDDVLPPAKPTMLMVVSPTGYADIELEWNDNSEPDLAGYNVYRSLFSGGSSYVKINTALITDSNYVDDTAEGPTYYYAVTAVDTNDNESGYSNETFNSLYGDFSGDYTVTWADVPTLVNLWLETDCGLTEGIDMDGNCIINFYEFSVFAKNWHQY